MSRKYQILADGLQTALMHLSFGAETANCRTAKQNADSDDDRAWLESIFQTVENNKVSIRVTYRMQ